MEKAQSAKQKRVAARSTKERAQDELVMQTNSSSIVSKRSVERIYYPYEPHYFRYFVKKFMRRAPLINRGYYLRLHVIDLAVRRFLERPSEKTKVVVNLGCGSDVLPWQCMSRYPEACRGAKFIDIDFPDLMSKKRTTVLGTPELSSVFEPLDTNAGGHVVLKSDMYCQIGCDLRNTADLEKALSSILDRSNCTFMFVAEVSITYMETEGADGVIKWASSLGEAEFCLLEQILPDGPSHPFAKTMLSHFDKLKTPLKSVFEYPSLEAQHRRFTRLGWGSVEVESLWQVWTDEKWISASKRRELDGIEPFDEWEEFALFASHYCVVIARNAAAVAPEQVEHVARPDHVPKLRYPDSRWTACPAAGGKRRFGAALKLRDDLGGEVFANTFGIGTNNRLRSCDFFTTGPSAPPPRFKKPTSGPGSRVCHAVADLGHWGSLLVGGRASPTTALRNCWHFSVERREWSPAEDLPVPLYRHAVTRLGRSSMVLLVGGKSDVSTIFNGCLLYRPGSGWTKCSVSESPSEPVFGAALVSFPEQDTGASETVVFRGILAGGLLEDGTVSRSPYYWTLSVPNDGEATISFELISASREITDLMSRFAPYALPLGYMRFALLGGIEHDGLVPQEDELLVFDLSDPKCNLVSQFPPNELDSLSKTHRPLWVGTAVSLNDAGQIVVMGGGATCFSMGTFWNDGTYVFDLRRILSREMSPGRLHGLVFDSTAEITDAPALTSKGSGSKADSQPAEITEIPRIRLGNRESFEEVLRAGKPIIIEGSNLGACVEKWTAAYLKEKVGPERKIVVHEATSSAMDFNAKNFSYVVKDFASFLAAVEKGGKQYLRALSGEHPSDQPANLATDFPGLADDFRIPPELSFVAEHLFSSVLRISGRVNMWLHYDVMANIYCQITGSKQLVLFPPQDVSRLSLAPGSSSSSLDIFSSSSSSGPPPSTHPHSATLCPGDILYLPPVWLHTAQPQSDMGVAVNVFFRNHPHHETSSSGSGSSIYAAGRDVYGNRDVAAYERARADVSRIVASMERLPRDMRAFYMARLVDELAANVPK
ncbi:leucine carboxyl methyltransferase [Xylariaceae sp. FL0594]|nr:leucine carboxyl methyltransferase [Xylariaceae sp. FL0594]